MWTNITTEPNGTIAGQTTILNFEPNPHIRKVKQIAMLEGSRLAEAKCGITDHSGCTHDQSVIKAIASTSTNPEALMQEGRSLARTIMNTISVKELVADGIALANEPQVMYFNTTRRTSPQAA